MQFRTGPCAVPDMSHTWFRNQGKGCPSDVTTPLPSGFPQKYSFHIPSSSTPILQVDAQGQELGEGAAAVGMGGLILWWMLWARELAAGFNCRRRHIHP